MDWHVDSRMDFKVNKRILTNNSRPSIEFDLGLKRKNYPIPLPAMLPLSLDCVFNAIE